MNNDKELLQKRIDRLCDGDVVMYAKRVGCYPETIRRMLVGEYKVSRKVLGIGIPPKGLKYAGG